MKSITLGLFIAMRQKHALHSSACKFLCNMQLSQNGGILQSKTTLQLRSLSHFCLLRIKAFLPVCHQWSRTGTPKLFFAHSSVSTSHRSPAKNNDCNLQGSRAHPSLTLRKQDNTRHCVQFRLNIDQNPSCVWTCLPTDMAHVQFVRITSINSKRN